MERYSKEQRVFIVKSFIQNLLQKLDLALLFGHPLLADVAYITDALKRQLHYVHTTLNLKTYRAQQKLTLRLVCYNSCETPQIKCVWILNCLVSAPRQ
jgi:hypothetical protein